MQTLENVSATDASLKQLVRKAYGAIAEQPRDRKTASACGCGPLDDATIMADDYAQLAGYVADADLGLGCGLPTQFAQIKPGDTVIDLGSGAGNDCFVARHETGPAGKVIGIDFTEAMIDRARRNADGRGFNNVEFRFGDIEQMPVGDNVADVIVSNCVLNLVPNKPAVIDEIFRVLKPGGHFSISDIVLLRDLPETLRRPAELYSGCITGAVHKDEYLDIIDRAGFVNVTLQKEKPINLSNAFLAEYLSIDEIAAYHSLSTGIVSVTVYAEKPVVASVEVVNAPVAAEAG
ncbi:MAG: arsenite methyltransferase, partial [Rudanella sp.]|nr:arsenite methyltransferase [Rudanella sp.]